MGLLAFGFEAAQEVRTVINTITTTMTGSGVVARTRTLFGAGVLPTFGPSRRLLA